MKKLNAEEIKQFADALSFTESDAKEITDLFYNLKMENPVNYWKVYKPLNDVDEYIREWEDHWHRESDWLEYYQYEKDNCVYDYEMAEKVFESLESFKDCVDDCSHELSSGLIAIVC